MESVKANWKLVLIGLIIGGIVGMFAMPNWFSYVSKSKASEQADQAVITAFVPSCVKNALAEPEKLAEVMAMSSYQRDDGVEAAGWAVYPESADVRTKNKVVDDCVDALEKL